MPRLILCMPGRLGRGLLDAAASYGLNISNVIAVDTQKREEFHRNLGTLLRSMRPNESICILLDAQASASSQEVMLELEKCSMLGRSLLVFGVNAPAVSAAVRWHDAVDTLDELQKTIESEAKSGISSWLSQN